MQILGCVGAYNVVRFGIKGSVLRDSMKGDEGREFGHDGRKVGWRMKLSLS